MERRDDKPVEEVQGHGEMMAIDVISSSNNTQTIMLLPFVSSHLNPWALLIIMTQWELKGEITHKKKDVNHFISTATLHILCFALIVQ